jgi:hypothetical protein
LDDNQFDAFLAHLDGLLTTLVDVQGRLVRVSEEQSITNHRLELLILEVIRQRRNGNPN